MGSLFLVEGNHSLLFSPFFHPLHCFFYSATYSFQTGRNSSFRSWEASTDTSHEQKLMESPSEIEHITALLNYILTI